MFVINSLGAKVVVDLKGGSRCTERVEHQSVEVKRVVGRDPEDGLQVERVQLHQQPLYMKYRTTHCTL